MSAIATLRRFVPLAVTVAAALAGAVLPAAAKRAPDPSSSDRLLSAPAPHRQIESVGPVRRVGNAQSRYGIETGVLRRYWRLSPASPGSRVNNPRQVALGYLHDHATELGIRADRLDDQLQLAYEKISPSGTHLRWQQVVERRAGLALRHRGQGVAEARVASVQNNLRPVTCALDHARRSTPTVRSGSRLQAIDPTGHAIGDFKAELYVMRPRTGPRLAYVGERAGRAPDGRLARLRRRAVRRRPRRSRTPWSTHRHRARLRPRSRTKMADSNAASTAPTPTARSRSRRPTTRARCSTSPFTAGIYSLSGPFATHRSTSSRRSFAPVTATDPDSFQFQRIRAGFEDVMRYYHIDSASATSRASASPTSTTGCRSSTRHGFNGADNSHYVPVDQARSPSATAASTTPRTPTSSVHEYGHSIQDNIVPGWGGGQEGAMGEGFGDYWAGTLLPARCTRPVPDRATSSTGTATTRFWPGRSARSTPACTTRRTAAARCTTRARCGARA